MARFATLVMVLVLTSQPALADKIIVLVSDKSGQDKAEFWWACTGKQPSALLEQIGGAINRGGHKAVFKCDAREQQIHKSYRHTPLLNHEMINLANALEGKRIFAGQFTVVEKKPISWLSLRHFKATLQLSVLDIDTERQTGQLLLSANGYHQDVRKAKTLAHTAISAKLLQHMGALVATKPKPVKKVVRKGLIVRVTGLTRAGELDTLKKTLAVVPGVKKVTYDEITPLGGTLVVLPKTSRSAVEHHLKTLPFTATIDP